MTLNSSSISEHFCADVSFSEAEFNVFCQAQHESMRALCWAVCCTSGGDSITRSSPQRSTASTAGTQMFCTFVLRRVPVHEGHSVASFALALQCLHEMSSMLHIHVGEMH